MRKTFTFRSTAVAVTDLASTDLRALPGIQSVEVKRPRNGCAGTLIVEVEDRADLLYVAKYIKNHRLYRHHFTE